MPRVSDINPPHSYLQVPGTFNEIYFEILADYYSGKDSSNYLCLEKPDELEMRKKPTTLDLDSLL